MGEAFCHKKSGAAVSLHVLSEIQLSGAIPSRFTNRRRGKRRQATRQLPAMPKKEREAKKAAFAMKQELDSESACAAQPILRTSMAHRAPPARPQ